MPQPTSTADLRPDLGGSFEEISLEMIREGFIGLQVAPVIDVAKQTGSFGRIPVEQLLKKRSTERAPGAPYSRGEWKFEPDNYACTENGTEEPVDDRESEMYSDYFDAEMVSARRARHIVLSNIEQTIADSLFNTTVWNGAALTTGISTDWTNHSSATPIDNILDAQKKVWDGCGIWPNTVVMTRNAYRQLIRCDQIKDGLEAQGAGISSAAGRIKLSQIAELFDCERILVAGGVKNIADDGQAASLAHIWNDDYVSVCHTSASMDFRDPCVMRTFHWSQDGSRIGCAMETYRDEKVRGNVVRARCDTHHKRMYVQAAHLLTGALT